MLSNFLDELRAAPRPDPWLGKRFEWLSRLSPVEAGTVGAELYVRAFGGHMIGRDGSHDVEHNGKLIEAKLALRAKQSEKQFRYQWANFRTGDSWTHAWLVAVDYQSVRAFLVPRADVSLKPMKESKQAYWVGNEAKHDTAAPPEWLSDHEVMGRHRQIEAPRDP